jgi:hypothetical protein
MTCPVFARTIELTSASTAVALVVSSIVEPIRDCRSVIVAREVAMIWTP